MTGYANQADYQTHVASLRTYRGQFTAVTINPIGGLGSYWKQNAFSAAATPSTAVVLDRTSAGAYGQVNAGAFRIPRFRQCATGQVGARILCDRLSHQGGLVANVITTQTTNLPTAALTRYTSGAGVMAAIEVYTGTGATGCPTTLSYTNQAGTAGRTSKEVDIGSAAGATTSRLFLVPLQAGDTGIRSVESLTCSVSSGTAGNIGVTLFKPLVAVPYPSADAMEFDALDDLGLQLPLIAQDACLFWMALTMQAAIPTFFDELMLTED